MVSQFYDNYDVDKNISISLFQRQVQLAALICSTKQRQHIAKEKETAEQSRWYHR